MDNLLRAVGGAGKRLDRLEARQIINPAARYTRGTAQTITSGGSSQIIDYATQEHDPRGLVTTGASWHFTAPVGGLYQVDASASLAGSTGWAVTEGATLSVFKNGAAYARLFSRDDQASASSISIHLHGSTLVYLAAGETLDIRLFQSSGGSINLVADATFNYVGIHKVGG